MLKLYKLRWIPSFLWPVSYLPDKEETDEIANIPCKLAFYPL